MKRIRVVVFLAVLAAVAGGIYWLEGRPVPLVLTGIVTTNDVIVSPQIAGQVAQMLVKEGDQVASDQLLALIAPEELKADEAYFAHSAEGLAVQVGESEAALRFQEKQTAQQIQQARANVASTEAQRAEAAADLANAKSNFEREQALAKSGAVSDHDVDQQRTAFVVASARLESMDRQLEAQRAGLALARAAEEQVTMKRSALAAAEQGQAAAAAQTKKAAVRLGYAEIHAPVAGIVDVRAVRQGEFVAVGQPILTLVNPDDLWVRADVEESYIDRVRLGDSLDVRLPSGETRAGTVFYRGVDAGFATQRDVSRTKRDIKTFEIRLRVDNKDRRLAVGMTAYVLFSVP